MKNLSQMLKAAQAMQEKMGRLQEELAEAEVVGEAGAGLVRVTMNARGDLRAISIDPSLLKEEEREVLEDLVVAAHKDARRKAEERLKEEMAKATAGLGLPPGVQLPF